MMTFMLYDAKLEPLWQLRATGRMLLKATK
jgi:hypothetical protein